MRPTSRQKEYWYLRELKAKREYDKSEAETLKGLTKIYQDMEASVQKEIDAFYGRYAKKEGITMAEARRRADRLDIEEEG